MSHDGRVEDLGKTRERLDSNVLAEATHLEPSNDMPGKDAPLLNLFDNRPTSLPISVAIDPVALITTECITVTSAMRKHARWAHSSVSAILGGSASSLNTVAQAPTPPTPGDDLSLRNGHIIRPSPIDDGTLANRWGLRGKKGKSMQDNPLMAGFGRLRRDLVGCKGREGCWLPFIMIPNLADAMQIFALLMLLHFYIHSSKLSRHLQPQLLLPRWLLSPLQNSSHTTSSVMIHLVYRWLCSLCRRQSLTVGLKQVTLQQMR